VNDWGGLPMKLGDYLRCLRLNTSVALREFYKGRQIAYQDCLAPRAHDSALFPLREQTADGEQGRAGQLREFLTRLLGTVCDDRVKGYKSQGSK